jgi:uncharacterized protein (DUF885 family)
MMLNETLEKHSHHDSVKKLFPEAEFQLSLQKANPWDNPWFLANMGMNARVGGWAFYSQGVHLKIF